ncbi:MAG: DUF6933 domain-containing protein [Thermoleophilia bacterium]
MQLIGCTKKLQKEMGLGVKDLVTLEPENSGLGPWTTNLIFINRRKCILFVNDKTLFNFLVPDMLRQHIRELDKMFRDWFSCTLAGEGFTPAQTDKILEEYESIGYSKTRSRSVLGSMNDLAFMYKYELQSSSLHRWDFPEIIKKMNRMIVGSQRDYHYPVERLFDIYHPLLLK